MNPTILIFRNIASAILILLITSLNVMAQCPEPENAKVFDITGTTVKANWSPVPDAMGYDYALNTDSMPPSTGHSTTSTVVMLQGLAPNTKYCLHIRSLCTSGKSDWVTRCFTTTCSGVQVQDLIVENISGSTARAMWTTFQNGNGYEYAISEAATPPASGTSTTSNVVLFQGLESGKSYCVHVRSLCSLSGTYTDWQTTCFNTVTDVANITTNNATRIYPNPVKTMLNIDIKGLVSTHTVILRDVVGRVVLRSALQKHHTSINISAITPGIYYISISGADVNIVQRIVKE